MRKKQIWIKTQDAIDHFGGKTQLAEALGVTISAVSQYGEYLPDHRCWQAQQITENALPVIHSESDEVA